MSNLTRNVLREELLPNLFSLFAAVGKGIPYNVHEKIRVVSWVHDTVFDHTLSKNGTVDKYVDVEIGNGSRVICGIGEVDVEL